jgi:DNA-binding transcriptional LysR family regulator
MLTLEALNATTLHWHSVFTSPSLADLRAAALTGLAIAALSPQNMQPGMKILDGTYGLPPLPNLDTLLIYGEDEPTPAVREFGRLIQQEAAARTMHA